MALYGFVAFSGAFLLFLVQPLIGKFVLPWFGGGSMVWTTCLLVFQSLLVAGYAYAWVSTRWLKPRTQFILHFVLLLVAIVLLPITPGTWWKPHSSNNPALRICLMLVATLGLPFIVLAATAPLLQFWFSLVHPGTSPFRLYALSNAGSLAALLVYPSVFETQFTRSRQATIWGAGLAVFALSCAWTGFRVCKTGLAAARSEAPKTLCPTPPANKLLWVLLPACGSLLLFATTNKLCQDLAPIALLWILPLTAYLASFILCFTAPRLYDRRFFGPALLLSLAVMALSISGTLSFSASAQVIIFCLGLFICCTVCHGEVYRLRPQPAHLPAFYLTLSAGGALGGAFVAVIAPLIFSDYFELHLGLLLSGGIFLAMCWREQKTTSRKAWPRVGFAGGTAALVSLAILLWGAAHNNDSIRVYRARNFYAVLNVYRHPASDAAMNLIELVHGSIAHGVQFSETNRARIPTLYYTRDSGVGRAMAALQQPNRRIGVVGLGAGTLAAYLRTGDQIRFYEINPEVEKIANTFFTFLRDCPGKSEVILGDARLSLENEPPQDFDLLVLDAFNSDSIPIHLLTREAFAVYQRHLKTNGIIVLNISNLSLDLEPVITSLGLQLGFATATIGQPVSNEPEGVLPSSWVVLSRDPHLMSALSVYASKREPLAWAAEHPVWTDDFNSVFTVLRWRDMLGLQPPLSASAARTTTPAKPKPETIQTEQAIQRFRDEIARDPNSPVALNNLACLLATAADPALRNGPEAVTLAEKACALTQYQNTSVVSTLAAAYAEAGRFDEAVATAEKACSMAAQKGEQGLLTGNQQMLQFYRNKRPFHQGQ